MTNPKATLHMANGADIVIELLPEAAPNTVNSFIYAASHGYLDHHAIERIVPGNWVDVSYTAFGHKELQYLIPNEFALNPDVTPLDSHPGCVCMGGYFLHTKNLLSIVSCISIVFPVPPDFNALTNSYFLFVGKSTISPSLNSEINFGIFIPLFTNQLFTPLRLH